MLCEMNCGREKTRVKWCKYVCDFCEPKPIFNFLPVDTVRFAQAGNVSKARVEMIKRRTLHPEGNGDVVLKDHRGKITNRSADDY